MSVELLSPEGLAQEVPFRHVAVGTGSRTVCVAGQVSVNAQGAAVAPGDLSGQVAQALRNVAAGLAGAGASFADVVRLRFYLTDWRTEKHDDFLAGIAAVAQELGIPQPMPPATLIGVAALFEPHVLIEIEATAVLD
ncbi:MULTISPECIES: RidA family protein [unclassified Leucobacter]|uniref:RidA family protein n=1 Tax=unclassified Leucobacter TaxID=2621730 RepID=UPI00301728BA